MTFSICVRERYEDGEFPAERRFDGPDAHAVRFSWNEFCGPTATDEFGEVNDFTIEVR